MEDSELRRFLTDFRCRVTDVGTLWLRVTIVSMRLASCQNATFADDCHFSECLIICV